MTQHVQDARPVDRIAHALRFDHGEVSQAMMTLYTQEMLDAVRFTAEGLR